MRSVIALLVALTVAVLGTTAILLLTPESWKRRISVVLTNGTSAAKPAETAPAAPPEKPPHAAKHALGTTGQWLQTAPPVESATAMAAPAVPLPFPIDRDVASGSPRATVVRRFGEPNAAVTLADAGRLMERYIYLDKSSRRQTFIVLVNGRVVGSQTIPGFQ